MGERADAPRSRDRQLLRWTIVFIVVGVSLYLVLPSLLATFGDLPQLRHLAYWWFPLLFVVEALSFWSLWYLQRVVLRAPKLFPVACSQLAGNALSRVVPGGAAAGGVLQRRFLVRSGLDRTSVTTSLAAAGLLTLTTLFGLPLLTIPALLVGEAVVPPLFKAALIAIALFVVLAVSGTVVLSADRAFVSCARLVGRVKARLRRKSKSGPTADEFATQLLDNRN